MGYSVCNRPDEDRYSCLEQRKRRIASQSVKDCTMVEKRRKISNSAAVDEDESGQQSFGTEVGCQVSTTDSETQTDSQFLCKNDI